MINTLKIKDSFMDDSLSHYLKDKKAQHFRGKTFYKAKNYKASYYIDESVLKLLHLGAQEVELESNSMSRHMAKGLIKWDILQKRILISESKIREYFQPFEIE